jgi:hypothetical protein
VAGRRGTEISLLELDGRDPRLSTMVKLADSLHVSVSELLSGL